MMVDKSAMDCRTAKEIQRETIQSVLTLQDEIELLFPWKSSFYDNEVIFTNDTIRKIINYIQQLKEDKNAN